MSSAHANFFYRRRNVLDLQEIKERMRDRKISSVAEAIGVHKVTLYRVLSGEQSPSYETLHALSDYLLERGRFSREKDGEA